jgi:DNA-directed RNA polymerase specialized sigma24 family protein
MATTPLVLELEMGTVPLVIPAPGQAARSLVKIPRLGAVVAPTPPLRHQQLLKLLRSVVSRTCPSYLRNDEDDIVQTVLIRLVDNLDAVEAQLEGCLVGLQDDGEGRDLVAIAKTLENCRRELETFGSRGKIGNIQRWIAKCSSTIDSDDGRKQTDVVELLEKCLVQLKSSDGKVIFANYYVRQNVLWAIMDARKKYLRQPGVPVEDAGGGELILPETPSDERPLLIRTAIEDCLAQLDESKAEPTHLALLGHTVPEIAEALDLSIRQAESRVRRGKEFLRNCLIDKGMKP